MGCQRTVREYRAPKLPLATGLTVGVRGRIQLMMRARIVLSLCLVGIACKSDETTAPTPGAAPGCTCEEKEDCTACYAHIGECCYEDATIRGRAHLLVANCERDGRCSSCCNECVAKSCEDLRAAHDCPYAEE
jgi:hypothetical protein